MELLDLNKPAAASANYSVDRIKSTDEISRHPAVLLVDGIAKLTKGNLSAWQGIAKSKKTFALTLTIASLVRGESVHEKFSPVGDGIVAWFDTEQSPFDAQKITKRLKQMCGGEDRLMFYALRKYGAVERVAKIDSFLKDHGHECDVLVIDGVRDLIIDFNDPVESSTITTRLMAWSIDYDLHITMVLHANKGDGNMRGHLGTELENKCETVFSVTKDDNKKDVSLVEEKFGRGKEIDSFEIIIDDQGLPKVLEDSTISYESDVAPY